MSSKVFVFPNKPLSIFKPNQFEEIINLKEWLVQPKWDGHRALPVCDLNGNVTVYSRQKEILGRAGNQFKWLSLLDLPRPWQLDGELTQDKRLIIWDLAVLGGEYLFQKPYSLRLEKLKELLPKKLKKELTSIELIETLPASKYKQFFLRKADTHLEGIVFKSPKATDLWGPFKTRNVASQLKYRFEKLK